jgi:hypothetical protein
MVLLEIDAIGIAVREFECYAPRTVDVDRAALPALERVEVKSGQVHIFGASRIVQSVEPPQAPRVQGLLDLRCRAPFEQLLQALCLKPLIMIAV